MSNQRFPFGQVVRAFVGALRLTLGGKVAPAPNSIDGIAATFPQTAAWLRQSTLLLAEIVIDVEKHNVNLKTTIVHIEGRDWMMGTILDGVRFHAVQEYPHLLRNEPAYAQLALRASNLNDQFRVARLAEVPDLPPTTRDALQRLADHLAQPPSGV
ncbi:MAG: hypothetical protein SGI73_19045 [Chloroflexota bacterium]|nr:hypothetical protein [Chloroflexota bacterium]